MNIFALVLAVFLATSVHAGWNGGGGSGGGGGGGGALDLSTADTTVGNSIAETTLYTFTLPANTLGATGCASQRIIGTLTGNASATLALKAYFGAGTTTATFVPATVTAEPLHIDVAVCGDGTTGAQQIELIATVNNAAVVRTARTTIAVDSTTQQIFQVTAQWATATSAATLTKLYASTEGGLSTAFLLSASSNGILKQTAPGVTAVATPGTDYVTPAGNTATNTSSTATGSVAATNVQAAIVELEAEKQPLDPKLTTLAGKGLQGTGADVRYTTGSFTANNLLTSDVNGNVIDSGTALSTIGTVADNSITNAKLADMNSARIKGRVAGGSGDPQELTAADVLSILDVGTNDGTPNQGGDLVSWSKLKDVPAGFADGTDDGSGGGGSDTLQDVVSRGRSVTDAVSLATAVCLGSTTEKHCFYGNPTEGIVWAVSGGGDYRWQLANTGGWDLEDHLGADIISVDEVTKAVTIPNLSVQNLTVTSTIRESAYWEAGGISVDGTNCTAPTEQTINSGPRVRAFSCADTNQSQFFGNMTMPDRYSGGPVTFELSVVHGTTETITFGGAFAAMCRRPGTTINNTWGPDIETDVAITTAFRLEQGQSTTVTPNGPCQAGDVLFWRYVITAGSFSPNAANTKVLGVKMVYPTNQITDLFGD